MEDAAPVPHPRLLSLIDGFAVRWGLSDADVALRLAIAPDTLQEWRTRGVRRLPDRPVLEAIASALGVQYQRVLQVCLADTGYLAASTGPSAPGGAAVQELGAYADSIPTHKLPAFELPCVHLEPSRSAGAPHAVRARAYLHLVDADQPGSVVIGGYADFLLISLDAGPTANGTEPVTATSVYAPLFPGDVPRPGLLTDAEDGRWGLLVEDVFVDPAFRGNWLAAYLVAAIAQRIAGQTGPGLIAICPHTPDVLHTHRDDDAEDLSQRSRDYWQDHLRMTATDDGFLVVSTGSAAFAAAVDEHKVVDDVFICVDREQLLLRRRNNDRKLWPATNNPLAANHSRRGDNAASTDTACVTSFFGGQHFTELNRIIAGVQHLDDMTYTSVTAVISFVGPDPTNQQQSNVFARAAHYLAEHPEIAVSSTHWRDFTDERGADMYALDIEVIPPSWRDALLR